jgi:hypothetical protein
MRRSLAILALLATSWPHVVVLECALGSASPAAAQQAGHEGRHAHARGHRGTANGHGMGLRVESTADVSEGAQQCAMVMACGLVMIQAESRAAAAMQASAPDAGPVGAVNAPSTADLEADPPPPRRHA